MEIPHCPNPECANFSAPPEGRWYIRYGYHRTKAFGTVQRYRCKRCGKTFSTQTFLIDYYAKKLIDYTSLMEQLVTASGLLDMSRKMKVRPESIENRFERLARCVLAIHAEILKALPMDEDIVFDGFESFAYSQYFPHHVNIAVGKESEFIYTLGFANLRRKGRMTDAQKKKRELLEVIDRAHPKAIEISVYHIMKDLVERITAKGITTKKLYTDEHAAYPRACRRVDGFDHLFTHVRISSKDTRKRGKDLFVVDYIDHQFRKDLSDHARETMQFSKDPSAMMARMTVYRFYHNCCIPRRVRESRRGNDETHAERAGIAPTRLQHIVFSHWGKRAFLKKTFLCCEELNTWLCAWRNPGIPYGRYIPKYITI